MFNCIPIYYSIMCVGAWVRVCVRVSVFLSLSVCVRACACMCGENGEKIMRKTSKTVAGRYKGMDVAEFE